MKAERSDLKALLIANKPDKGNYHFSQRLAFVMNEASIDNLLKQLSDSALTLRNFVDDNEDLHHIQRSNKEPQQARQTKVANSLHKCEGMLMLYFARLRVVGVVIAMRVMGLCFVSSTDVKAGATPRRHHLVEALRRSGSPYCFHGKMMPYKKAFHGTKQQL